MMLVRLCETSQEIARIIFTFELKLCKKKTSEKEDNFCKFNSFIYNKLP